MTNIILCGGNGTRLWPISRTLMPKQFVKLFNEQENKKSLFQLTVKRNSKVCTSSYVVSNTEQYFLSIDQLEELNETNNKYLLEPIGRNTAPAIALACLDLPKDEIVLVTPSDHLIKDECEYKNVLEKAKELANENNLVTFGITPTFAETGFGYIEVETKENHPTHTLASGVSAFAVKQKVEEVPFGYSARAFHEKPNEEMAQKYLRSGNYYWNSGMFMFKAGVFLDELKKYSPSIYEASLKAFNNAFVENSLRRIKHEDMINIPEDSIDYAVMEKSTKVKVIPSNISWSDVGSFDSLYEELPLDENNNTINENHISIDSSNNLIYGQMRKIATVDIEDTIIVDTGDALLISKKGSSQKVKQVVQKLKEQKSELHNIHLTGHRPWGTYTVLEDSPGYKIKKIEVKANSRLSLQKHFHRNEHWVVVSGCATVTIEDKTFILNPNESTYIKAGQVHRLENQGKLPLVIIEAQVGQYTGEDDIVRIDDDFKRD